MRRSLGHTLAMIFREELDANPRVSFDMAIRQLGGTSDRSWMRDGTQLGRGETDCRYRARPVSRMVDAIMIVRTDDHSQD